MSDVVLILGTVVFQNFEVPGGIVFGGRQRLAVHQLTDGRRIVDCVGPDESEIAFSGVFSGPDAALRARLVNGLRVSGNELDLTWDIFIYSVIVAEFHADYQNPFWIPYRISCTIVQDDSTPPIDLTSALACPVTADIATAVGLCAGSGISLTDVQSILADPNATTLGSSAYMQAQAGISRVQGAIITSLAAVEATFDGDSTIISTFTDSMVSNIRAMAAAAAELASLVDARGYVGRAARNLSNAST